MGKKVQAPPSPDYAGAAQAQGQANQASALQGSYLSNPNIRTPYGNQTVEWDAAGHPTVYQDLPPLAAAALEQQQAAGLGLSTLANQQTARVGNILNTPFNYQDGTIDQLPNAGQIQMGNGGVGQYMPQSSGGLTYGGDLASPGGAVGQYMPQTEGGLQFQRSDGLPPPPGGMNQAQGVNVSPNTQRTYEQATGGPPTNASVNLNEAGNAQMPINAGTSAQQLIMQRLAPTLAQNRKSFENQLAQQGLVPGGEAYDNASRLYGQQENDQLTQAALQGIGLDMSANQQGFNQALARGQFGNQGIGQNFEQGLAAAQFGNQARQQNFGNALDLQGFNNTAAGQNFSQGLQGQAAANAAQQQAFNQGLQGSQFTNQARQQQLANALMQRQLPLNEITALLSGSQIQNPAFQQYQGQDVAPAPTFAATQAQGQFDMNRYNQEVAQRNAMMGGLFGLGGALTGGLFGLGR